MQDALDAIHDKSIPIDHFITHRFPLSKTKVAFDLLDAYKDGVVKAMINLQ